MRSRAAAQLQRQATSFVAESFRGETNATINQLMVWDAKAPRLLFEDRLRDPRGPTAALNGVGRPRSRLGASVGEQTNATINHAKVLMRWRRGYNYRE